MRPVTPGREHRHRLAVIVIAQDRGNGQVHHPGNLAGDGGEDLLRLRALGHQRGHAAQRRLLERQPLGHRPAVFVVTATRLSGLGTVIWPVRGIPVTCCDGRRIRLAHNNCSTVIGSDRMRRPVAWYTALAMAAGRPPILFDGLIVHLLRESRKGRGGAFPIPARRSIFTIS